MARRQNTREWYTLEIFNWISFESDWSNASLSRVLAYANAMYPANTWRIIDIAGCVVYESDGISFLERDARQELNRFSETEHWRSTYARRRLEEMERERERLRQIHRVPFWADAWDDATLWGGNNNIKVNWKKQGF